MKQAVSNGERLSDLGDSYDRARSALADPATRDGQTLAT